MMSAGNAGPIKERPDDWDKIVEKHHAREQELVDKLLKKRKAETTQELQDLAKKAIVTRMTRLASDHTTLKDRAVKREAEGGDVMELRSALNAEIKELSRALLEKAPDAAKSSLKGRKITLGGVPPTASGG